MKLATLSRPLACAAAAILGWQIVVGVVDREREEAWSVCDRRVDEPGAAAPAFARLNGFATREAALRMTESERIRAVLGGRTPILDALLGLPERATVVIYCTEPEREEFLLDLAAFAFPRRLLPVTVDLGVRRTAEAAAGLAAMGGGEVYVLAMRSRPDIAWGEICDPAGAGADWRLWRRRGGG